MHNMFLDTQGINDPDTLAFWRDLHSVMDNLHRGMSIVGFWMEARIKMIVRNWLPAGWTVSGPSQVFIPDQEGLRSRSWDVVVHRVPPRPQDLPPAASSESGYPLLPCHSVAAVINTKTNFADPRQYALQPVFNLMNDAVERQLDFLGEGIAKMILVAASPSRSPDSMFAVGETCGLLTFSMGRYYASPVADANNRVSGWRLEKYSDGSYPLQRFKQAVLGAVSSFEARQGPTLPRRSARA